MSYTDSGLRYCIQHDGIVECDSDGPCDFADIDDPAHVDEDGELLPCELRALMYDRDDRCPAG